jgi:hypothetical protein
VEDTSWKVEEKNMESVIEVGSALGCEIRTAKGQTRRLASIPLPLPKKKKNFFFIPEAILIHRSFVFYSCAYFQAENG